MTYKRIEEYPIAGKPLGRHINHDDRSRFYAFKTARVPLSDTFHLRNIPIFDQGELGSCTGNAAIGACGTAPLYATHGLEVYNEALAVKVYSAATLLDDAPGTYPPTDTGSDGLSAAKVCKTLGLISGYQHAFTLNDALVALQTYPVITGVNWYEGFDTPDETGRVHVSGSIRGGHEFEVVSVNVAEKTVTAANSWGTSYGLNGYFTFSWDDWGILLSEQGDVTVLLPLTVPAPNPIPILDADNTFASILNPWVGKHPLCSRTIQKAAKSWLQTKGL